MKLSIQDLWVEKHPEMKAVEAALSEATQWDPDPAKYEERVEKAKDAVDKVREKLLGEFQRATMAPGRPTVPHHVQATAVPHSGRSSGKQG